MRRVPVGSFALMVIVVGSMISDQASAADEAVPSSRDGWPVVLVDKPFHIGDQTMEHFRHPKPMGRDVTCAFELDRVPLSVYVLVSAVDLMLPKDPEYRDGHYQTQLLINGKEIAVLNEELPRRVEPTDTVQLVIRVRNSDLIAGQNELVIRGGGRGGNIEEAEILRVELHNRRPPRPR